MKHLVICSFLFLMGCSTQCVADKDQLQMKVPDTLLQTPPQLKTLEEDQERIPMQPTKSIIATKNGESN